VRTLSVGVGWLLIGLSVILFCLLFFSEAFQMLYGLIVVFAAAPFVAIFGGDQRIFEIAVTGIWFTLPALPGVLGGFTILTGKNANA
jgi:hypothetical protein